MINNNTYELPDGNMITLSNNACRTPGEILFRSELQDIDTPVGIADIVRATLFACDIDTRNELYKSILLAGGTSLMKGFNTRLQNELMDSSLFIDNCYKYDSWYRMQYQCGNFLRNGGLTSFNAGQSIKVTAPPERKYSVWLGGSILGNLYSHETDYISKEDYDERGGIGILSSLCPWKFVKG